MRCFQIKCRLGPEEQARSRRSRDWTIDVRFITDSAHRFRAFLVREREMRNERTSWQGIDVRTGGQVVHRKSMGNRKYVMPSLSSWFIGETSTKTRGIARAFESWTVKIPAKMLKLCTIRTEWYMIDGFLTFNVNVIEFCVNFPQSWSASGF